MIFSPVKGVLEEAVAGGRRKGKAPLGEAWLLDETQVCGMLAARRYV
jgi:hypothetical protein